LSRSALLSIDRAHRYGHEVLYFYDAVSLMQGHLDWVIAGEMITVRMDCHVCQGFHLTRPLTPEGAEALLESAHGAASSPGMPPRP
jgi:cytosine/adenosine deaminase-related metal-dependent hydrolase